jgi:hypothetical protein
MPMPHPTAVLQRTLVDVQRALRGAVALLRYSLSAETRIAGLSQFTADSPSARLGELSTYRLAVANATPRQVWMRLLVDIYRKDDPSQGGHHAYFEKSVLVRRRESCALGFTYDWDGRATFVIGGVSVDPDVMWRGLSGGAGRYAVHAVQLDGRGLPVEQLTLVQELRL